MKYRTAPSLLILVALGCGKAPYEIAPVSGQVVYHGKPLASAHVFFQPMATDTNKEPGPESYAQTDAEGRFTLKVVVLNKPGAVVGKHRVRISKLAVGPERVLREGEDVFPSDPIKPPSGRATAGVRTREGAHFPPDPIPAKYNTESKLTFEVEPNGTDKALITLPSP